MGGLKEFSREGGGEGRGGHQALHLPEKNIWGQPIRCWVTLVSSQLACKSCGHKTIHVSLFDEQINAIIS